MKSCIIGFSQGPKYASAVLIFCRSTPQNGQTQSNHSSLRIWSHLLKKSLMENFIFCKVGIENLVLHRPWLLCYNVSNKLWSSFRSYLNLIFWQRVHHYIAILQCWVLASDIEQCSWKNRVMSEESCFTTDSLPMQLLFFYIQNRKMRLSKNIFTNTRLVFSPTWCSFFPEKILYATT